MLPDKNYMTESELRKEIQRLRKNLEARTAAIERSGAQSNYAVKAFKDIDDEIRSSNILLKKKGVTRGALYNLYSDLKYIDELKTSTVKGALKADKEWKPIESKLDTLSEDKRKQVFNLWNKAVSRAGYYGMKAKYSMFEQILADRQVLSRDDLPEEYFEDLVEKLSDDVDRAYNEMMTRENSGMYKTHREAENDFIQIFSRFSNSKLDR